MQHSRFTPARPAIRKAATGIQGLGEITDGGLPHGRPTLICGGAGSGKTLLATSFLVNGAEKFDEPGVLMTFEENGDEIASDVASLGFDYRMTGSGSRRSCCRRSSIFSFRANGRSIARRAASGWPHLGPSSGRPARWHRRCVQRGGQSREFVYDSVAVR